MVVSRMDARQFAGRGDDQMRAGGMGNGWGGSVARSLRAVPTILPTRLRTGLRTGLRIRLAVVMGAALVMAGGMVPAGAATIVGYDSANSPTTAVAAEWASGVTPRLLSRGSGLVAGSGATFNSSGWTGEATDYLEWGWSASPALDLQDLSLRYDRSTSGPAAVTLWLAVNGGPFQSLYEDPDVDVNGEDLVGFSLASFTNVTSATFRLTGANASAASGTLDIEPLTGVTPARGIVVRGAAAVPEPVALGWSASAGLFAFAAIGRRRNSAG